MQRTSEPSSRRRLRTPFHEEADRSASRRSRSRTRRTGGSCRSRSRVRTPNQEQGRGSIRKLEQELEQHREQLRALESKLSRERSLRRRTSPPGGAERGRQRLSKDNELERMRPRDRSSSRDRPAVKRSRADDDASATPRITRTNGFYVWFPSILNSLANHEGGETKICDVLDAGRDAVSNGTMICDDTIHTSTFERSIYIGLVFSSMYIIVGFLVDYVGKKPILVVILGFTGVSGICAHLAYNQQLAVVLFAVFQMSGACIGLMNAVAVELFPTKFRAMAICLSMMMGRVGSMVGSNLIGLFLEVNCGAGFYLFGSIIIINSLFCLTLPNKKRIPHKKIVVESTQNETHEPV